jgi:hypothetical protein
MQGSSDDALEKQLASMATFIHHSKGILLRSNKMDIPPLAFHHLVLGIRKLIETWNPLNLVVLCVFDHQIGRKRNY